MQFAMIANADHVPQLQRRKETMNLFATYLRGESIQNLDGILPMSREQMANIERRGEQRIEVQDASTQLSHRHSDLSMSAEILDLNYFGVLLSVENDAAAVQAAQYPRDLALHLRDQEGEFKIECLIFESAGAQLRALFKHGSFDVAERLLRFVQWQKEQMHLLEAV